MAYDLKLTSDTRDIQFDETGNLVFTETNDELVVQRVVQRLQTHLNEWAFNRELGVDYIGQIMVKAPNFAVIRAHFIEVIAGTPGVGAVIAYSADLNGRTLTVSVEFTVGEETVELVGAERDGDFVWIQL